MEFDHDDVRRAVEEDRLSSLPDDIIHKILSCFDMKFVVQTCSLSSRWKLLWTTMTCLNFSSRQFRLLRKFAKFVTNVLKRRNHQIEVSSVKLDFHGALNQIFVKKIANYAFSHNVQELAVVSSIVNLSPHFYPPCLFTSRSLKHLTLFYNYNLLSDKTITPWDFPALTSLNLSCIRMSGDLFSKFVNLKNLTLERFDGVGRKGVFDIITPRLSNLMLIDSNYIKTINVIAPQLESLTISNCSIKYLNAPPRLLSFCYTSCLHSNGLLEFTNDGFHSLNKVSICLAIYSPYMAYKEKDAHKTINMLQQLHSAKYLTLNEDTAECLSSFPDLLLQHSSPFSNLVCLTIDHNMRKNVVCEVTMSSQARTFMLDNFPSSTFIVKLPEV